MKGMMLINKIKEELLNDSIIGKEFKSCRSLYLYLFDVEMPTGKSKNKAKEIMSRYLEYQKVNPDNPRDNRIVVTKIYDKPIEVPENRGKSGKYIDYLRPIIINMGYFEGKSYEFYNRIGVFKQFHDDEYNKQPLGSCKRTHTCCDFNSLARYESDSSGLNKYKTDLYSLMNNTLKRCLDSLQEDGIIKWESKYAFIPNIFIDIENSYHYRRKDSTEYKRWRDEKNRTIRKYSKDDNFFLDRDLIKYTDIFSNKWPEESHSIDDYIEENQGDFHGAYISSTKRQKEAIENFETFVRQISWMKYRQLSSLPSIQEMKSNIFRFENDRALKSIFEKNVKKYAPILLNISHYWRIITFKVIASEEKIQEYLNRFSAKTDNPINKLEIEFINNMDSNIKKTQFLATKDDIEKGDIVIPFGTPSTQYYLLCKSKACMNYHKRLKKSISTIRVFSTCDSISVLKNERITILQETA